MARSIEVILTEDSQAGQAGQIKKAKPGFVRNFLLPRGLAVIADRFNMQAFEERKAGLEKLAGEKRQQAETAKDIIGEDACVTIEGRAGETGKLFGAITKEKIAEAVSKEFRLKLGKESIILKSPIKETGEHKIELDLGSNIKTKIKIKVIAA